MNNSKNVKTRLITRELDVYERHGMFIFKPHDGIENFRSCHFRKSKTCVLTQNTHEEFIDAVDYRIELNNLNIVVKILNDLKMN